MLEIFSGTDCPFLSVIVTGGLVTPVDWFGNVCEAGDSVTSPGVPPVAVPESVTFSEPEGYVTVTDPVFAPALNGANSI